MYQKNESPEEAQAWSPLLGPPQGTGPISLPLCDIPTALRYSHRPATSEHIALKCWEWWGPLRTPQMISKSSRETSKEVLWLPGFPMVPSPSGFGHQSGLGSTATPTQALPSPQHTPTGDGGLFSQPRCSCSRAKHRCNPTSNATAQAQVSAFCASRRPPYTFSF